MAVLNEYSDKCPYTGVRKVHGYLKIKENAKWLDGYFDGTPNYSQVTGVTRGKIYEVIEVEGHGDCEDVTFIDDNRELQTLADFFFEEVT